MTTQPQITYVTSTSQAASGYITRATMPSPFDTSPLWLFKEDTSPYTIDGVAVYQFAQDGMQPGGTIKRRQIAESTYMDDAFQVQSSKARIPATFNFIVVGKNPARLGENVDALIYAVDLQVEWELHLVITDAYPRAWSCWDAEVTVGFPAEHWQGVYAPVSVATQRSPIPLSGGL